MGPSRRQRRSRHWVRLAPIQTANLNDVEPMECLPHCPCSSGPRVKLKFSSLQRSNLPGARHSPNHYTGLVASVNRRWRMLGC
jgi:hypothetical protein